MALDGKPTQICTHSQTLPQRWHEQTTLPYRTSARGRGGRGHLGKKENQEVLVVRHDVRMDDYSTHVLHVKCHPPYKRANQQTKSPLLPFRPSPLPPAFYAKHYPRRIVRQWPKSPRRASSQHRVPCRRQKFLTETAGVGVFTSFVGFSRVRGSRFPSIPPGVSCPGCDWTSGR